MENDLAPPSLMTSASARSAYTSFSPGRIWTMATHTVTQLIRMRILIFMGIISMVIVVAAFAFPAVSPEQQLKLLKDWTFGALKIFFIIIAVAATGLLLPRDLEDRTLYTTLSKPVPRYEYLIGKLLGVMLLLGGGLLLMDLVFSLMLYLKQALIISSQIAALEKEQAATPENIAFIKDLNARFGLTYSLHSAVWAIFLQASVVAAVSLLISCFASSTLFTILVGIAFVIAGHGQALLREWFLDKMSGIWQKALSGAIAVFCPDLTLFDLAEPAIRGDVIPFGVLAEVSGIALLYIVGYTSVAYLFFVEKEL